MYRPCSGRVLRWLEMAVLILASVRLEAISPHPVASRTYDECRHDKYKHRRGPEFRTTGCGPPVQPADDPGRDLSQPGCDVADVSVFVSGGTGQRLAPGAPGKPCRRRRCPGDG